MDLDEFLDRISPELGHSGVKGMRWGVRRPVDSSGHVTGSAPAAKASGSSSKASSEHMSEDHKKAMAALSKANTHGLSSLSTEEMRHLTNRLEAEKKFNSLTNDQRSEISRQVEQMRLEKEYNQLSSERARASRSTGRKVVDALLGDLAKVATQESKNYSQKLIKDIMDKPVNQTKGKKAKPVKNLDELLKPYTK